MARAALKWSIDDLADTANVARMTVIRFERGDVVNEGSVDAMRNAFERNRIQFIERGRWAGAVYCGLKKAP